MEVAISLYRGATKEIVKKEYGSGIVERKN